jgi:hypothetical protein
MKRYRPIVLAAALLCAACTSANQQSSIAALEVGLATAETAAVAYKDLPPCGGTATVCSDPAIVAQMKAADNKAYDAIKAAEAKAATGASVDLTAATAALSLLQGIVATTPKGT